MTRISNTLRQRLGARPAPVPHPEADVLAAYLERGLPAAERDQVLRHLAACAECREVAVLSLPPESESPSSLVRPVAGRSRSWMLGLRFAALAATVAIVAVLAVKQPWKETQVAQTVAPPPTASDPAKIAPETAAQNTLTASGEPALDKHGLGLQSSQRSSAASVPALKSATAALTANAGKTRTNEGFINTTRFVKDDDEESSIADSSSDKKAAETVPSQPVVAESAASQQLTGGQDSATSQANLAQSNLVSDLSKTTSGPNGGMQPGSELPARASVYAKVARPFTTAAKKLPPIMARSLGGSAMNTPGTFSLAPPQNATNGASYAARYGYSRTLEKAKEKDTLAAPSPGATGLTESAAFTDSARASAPVTMERARREAQPTEWKVAEGKLLKSNNTVDWLDAYPQRDAGFAFSAVTARGNDVWAGGTHASLVHARDGGSVWERVKLGDAAQGSVTAITVSGVNITVKTSSQQVWTSQDAGRSWTLETQPE
ncbi:MAG TPA: YCF48-related protein [Verrucomicrobiae bacterium]|jgi:hypothetical protein|nr:YCF48-related protein [Verrucomicrobiae bacterium]